MFEMPLKRQLLRDNGVNSMLKFLLLPYKLRCSLTLTQKLGILALPSIRRLAMFLLLGCCSVLFSTAKAAENNPVLAPLDFAFGMEVTPKNKRALQSVVLPEHVYRYAIAQSLADVSVFNAHGDIVPSMIIDYNNKRAKTTITALPIFPLSSNTTVERDEVLLSLAQHNQNLSLALNNVPVDISKQEQIFAYIIDNAAENRALLTRLDIDWDLPKTGSIDDISLHSSEDLTAWRAIAPTASLFRLQHQGEQLLKNSIVLTEKADRYLKLSWRAPKNVVITKVTGVFSENISQRSVEQKTALFPLAKITNSEDEFDRDGYYISLPAAYPVSALALVSSANNYYFNTDIYARNNSQDAWRKIDRMVQYRLQVSDQVLESPVKVIESASYEHWLIKNRDSQPWSNNALPELEVSWQPKRLFFLAQGQGPFTVAYGNAATRGHNTRLQSFATTLPESEWQSAIVDQARLSDFFELGGQEKLRIAEPAREWQQLWLWAVLIAGVAVLGWMVFGLFRQMAVSEKESEQE